ncbi:hypothetical protein [Escherichia coli]|uniref:hypothetical protein n=1 Tax=Escherichia coli TaxID=562 RepID=UPI0007A022B7|nr:hypothetical protein [Escherichia coli]KYW22754.1 conjugal transfer protein TraE [Escherichia coli]
MKPDITGIATRMMLSLDRERICECLLSNRQLQSTPLQVRYPQGVRDALGIMSEQLSLSVSDLTRILVEEALSEMFLPADNIVRRLLCRMEHIMQAHDISATTMAALLAPWNIRPAVFREPDRLTDYLTGDILAALADWFYLSPEWLNGRVHYPLYRPGDWPVTQEAFCRIISSGENVDIILWHGFPFAGTHSGEYCGVLLRQKKEINNAIIYPVLSLYPVRMDMEKEGWFQMVRKISPDIPVRAVTLTPAQAEYLITGKILPTVLFRVSLSPW